MIARMQYIPTILPEINANAKHFSARALSERPYIIHGTLFDKYQFIDIESKSRHRVMAAFEKCQFLLDAMVMGRITPYWS